MNEPEKQHSTDFMLGQITAQLREMIHSQNNMSQAMNGLESGLGKRIDQLSNRVTALEHANERQQGATSLVSSILRSPVVGWVVGAVTAMWALVTGRLHL